MSHPKMRFCDDSSDRLAGVVIAALVGNMKGGRGSEEDDEDGNDEENEALSTIKKFSPPKQNLWYQAVQAALARKRISKERSLRRTQMNDIRRYFQPMTKSS